MYTRTVRVIPSLPHAAKSYQLYYAIYVTLVYVGYQYWGFSNLDIKMSIATVLGFAVAILLGFRTSASYDRWWEARKVWGAIVNDSRSLVRQLLEFTGDDPVNPEVRRLAHYQIAWCYALRSSLRGQDPLEDVTPHLSESEIDELRSKTNKPAEILKLMGASLRSLKEAGSIDAYQFVSLDQTLSRQCDQMGKCERIKNTVFPCQYRSFTKRGMVVFTLMLPYGMLFSTGAMVIPICLIVSMFFSLMDNIAYYLQDPFENRSSDIPMTALSRTIEINILEMLGGEDVPEPIQADARGVLM